MRLKTLVHITIASTFMVLLSCNPQKKLAREKHDYMEHTYVEITQAVNEAEVSILNDTLKVLFPSNLLYEPNGATIHIETLPIIERFANALIKYSKTDILINGYTDSTGTELLNERLSKARADTAKSALIFYKVPAGRLSSWGHGSKNPRGDNATEEGRTLNRRVEFIVLYKIAE